jgi:hypothetical protein
LDRGQELDWTNLVKEAAWTLVELARRRLGDTADARSAQKMYATTLTVVVIMPIDERRSKVSGVCAGDSAAWLLRASELVCIGGGKGTDDTGEPFSSVVTALPVVPNPVNVFEADLTSGDVLLVMSDGIGDPLGDGTGLLGHLLKDQLKEPPPLLQMARITDFSRETWTDDRTLAVLWPLTE